MKAIIEFCVNNMHHGTDRIFRRLEGNQEHDVIEYGCLGNCGQCFMEPYALVNGMVVSADSVDELMEKIESASSEKSNPYLDIDEDLL